jgi:hypothetical protein
MSNICTPLLCVDSAAGAATQNRPATCDSAVEKRGGFQSMLDVDSNGAVTPAESAEFKAFLLARAPPVDIGAPL